ncbi:macrolide family glycosyltransferase [Labedaea rhizosphaerae]|uniref:MGT family glycosyltransferase n=1 Tax=Labedaea rhizosphaerae TaxID=598644 RepID=A0A4R6S2L0_LABRH|nr:macrolide family glycosyltransferase [Labedaea rhizosphaerae]TDP92886.1 MGT family glycosyltransferase [Labedaea rhizosphaerae]
MSHVLVVNNCGFGHVMPTLDLVTELVRRGHRVTYASTGGPARLVAATGATVVEFDSALAGVDLAAVDTVDRSHQLLPLQVRESEAILRAVTAHFDTKPGGAELPDLPDVVAYDATVYHAGRILARKWAVPAVALCATLSSNEHFSLIDKIVETTGRKLPRAHPAMTEFATRLLRLLAEHGQSDVSLEEFIGHAEGLHLEFYPRSFQYAGDTFDDRHVFVGPHLGDPNAPPTWTPPDDDKPLLVVSLGTSANRRPEFFRTCAQALAELPWRILMTVHEGVSDADLGPLPPNVEVHRWLPLREVLAHADVFVCHGGMGSIMGALAHATPVVVVPDSPEGMVNAARVTELGLGRALAEQTLTPQRLRGAVREVATDPHIRDQVEAMRADIHDAGGGARGADAIEGFLKISHDRPGSGR